MREYYCLLEPNSKDAAGVRLLVQCDVECVASLVQ